MPDKLSATYQLSPKNFNKISSVPDLHPKAKAAKLAKQWGFDYWDGDRRINYGGYSYDGRWLAVAEAMTEHYRLQPGDKVLDVGCGKGFLVHDFLLAVPGIDARGIDVSEYAIEHAMPEVKNRVTLGHARELPFETNHFDLVVSINTLHNLHCNDLDSALREIERVGKNHKYICVESYRTEEEKANLLYWQVTCEAFNTPVEWQWWFDTTNFSGDHSFIYFE